MDIGIAYNDDYSLLLAQEEEYFYIYNLDTSTNSLNSGKYIWKMKDKVLPQINTISGHYLAVGDRNRIVLYDMDRGEAFQYSHNSEFTLCLGVLRNGDILISAESGLVVVYDPDERKEVSRMENTSGAFHIFPVDPKEVIEVKKELYSLLRSNVSKDLSDLVAKYI